MIIPLCLLLVTLSSTFAAQTALFCSFAQKESEQKSRRRIQEERQALARQQQAQQSMQRETMQHMAHQGTHAQEQLHEIQRQLIECQEQITRAVQNYAQQKKQLEKAALSWRESAPQRAHAYEQTRLNPQLTLRQYTLSYAAQKACNQAGIQINLFDGLAGNALQHTLMQEIIDGLNSVSRHTPCTTHYPFQQTMYTDTLHLFDDARSLNDAGFCVDSADLIDVGASIVDYLSTMAKGLKDGTCASIHQAVAGTLQLICHPVESIQSLGRVAVTLARVVHRFLPPELPDSACTAQEFELYLKRCVETAQHWHEAAQHMRRFWNNSSRSDILYHTSYGVARMTTDVFVAQQCTKILCRLAQAAQPYITAMSKQAGKTHIATTAPGYILLESQATREIMTYAETQGFTPAYVAHVLNNYVAEEAIEGKYHQLPGAQTLINDIFKHTAIPDSSRARGTSYELLCALELEKRGHTIVSFGQKIQEYTPDIITSTHIVECKNVRWDMVLQNKKHLERVQSQIKRGSHSAVEAHKQFMICSKHSIPSNIKDSLQLNQYHNVDIIEGIL